MAGLMSRAALVIKAKFSKLLDRAENPTETLDYSYEKQLELLQNVKRGLADVVTAKKRLQMQSDSLERKSAVQQQLQGLDAQVKGLEDQQEKLIANEKALQAKIEAFRSEKEVIKAQYSAAEASV